MKSLRPWVIQNFLILHLALLQHGGQALEAVYAGHEVVVEEKDEGLVAGGHAVGDHVGAEEAGSAVVELPDRAEVAVEGAAPGGEQARHRLGREEEVLPLVRLEQVPRGGREGIEAGRVLRLAALPSPVGEPEVHALEAVEQRGRARAAGHGAPAVDDLPEHQLTLAEHDDIDPVDVVALRVHGAVVAPDHREGVGHDLPREPEHGLGLVGVGGHRRGAHHIGAPGREQLRQHRGALQSHVDDADLGLRDHRGDGGEAHGLAAPDGVFEPEAALLEGRGLNQQDLHGVSVGGRAGLSGIE